MEMFSLAGQTALVTGSSRGLGLSIAIGLAKAGAQVVIHGSTEQSAAEGVRVLVSEGFEAIPLAFDVRDEAAAKAAAARLSAQGIEPSIVINNAGVNLRGSLAGIDFADWKRVLETNLDGAFLVARALRRADAQSGPRQNYQHLFVDLNSLPARHCALRHGEGWHANADPGNGR